MRVSIDHGEIKKGMLRKKTYHQVRIKVDFSEEELQIINANGLKYHVIHETEPSATRGASPSDDADWFYTKVAHFMQDEPSVHDCNTPLEAKQYEANITEGLKNLKALLDANKEVEEKSSSFEL